MRSKGTISLVAAVMLASVACSSADVTSSAAQESVGQVPEGSLQASSPLHDDGRSLAADLATTIHAGPAKEFPSELKDNSQEMPPGEVVRAWTEFLADTFVIDVTGAVTEYCSSGTGSRLGTVLGFSDQPGRVFEELRTIRFSWSVEPPQDGDPWNRALLVEDSNRKTLTTPDGYLFPGWAYSTNRIAVFENPRCGQPFAQPVPGNVVAVWEEFLTPPGSEEPITLRLKEFPPELLPGSEPLPWDEVVRLWTDWSSNTLMIEDAGLVIEFCEGGTGNTLAIAIEPIDAPEPLEWAYHNNRGHPWFEPRFVLRDIGNRLDLHNEVMRPPVDGFQNGPDESVGVQTFEHPTCGESVGDFSPESRSLEGADPSEVIQGSR